MGGTTTLTDAVPLAHGIVEGSPAIDGETEKMQLVARFTTAESLTLPPATVNEFVLAVKETTLGAVGRTDPLAEATAGEMPNNGLPASAKSETAVTIWRGNLIALRLIDQLKLGGR